MQCRCFYREYGRIMCTNDIECVCNVLSVLEYAVNSRAAALDGKAAKPPLVWCKHVRTLYKSVETPNTMWSNMAQTIITSKNNLVFRIVCATGVPYLVFGLDVAPAAELRQLASATLVTRRMFVRASDLPLDDVPMTKCCVPAHMCANILRAATTTDVHQHISALLHHVNRGAAPPSYEYQATLKQARTINSGPPGEMSAIEAMRACESANDVASLKYAFALLVNAVSTSVHDTAR